MLLRKLLPYYKLAWVPTAIHSAILKVPSLLSWKGVLIKQGLEASFPKLRLYKCSKSKKWFAIAM